MLDSSSMRSIPLRLWALVMLSAVLQLLPFPLAGPVPLWRREVCWFCLVPVLLALLDERKQETTLKPLAGFLLGYVFGFFWFLGNCYWIYQTMNRYGGLPPLASAGILVLFSLYLGLYFALFGGLLVTLRRYTSRQTALLLAPVLWVAVELARARITGFPWDLLGYTQVDNFGLTWIARLAGTMGLSLLVAAGNAAWLWRPAKGVRWAGPVLTTGLLVLQALSGHLAPPPQSATASAVLLQDNLRVGAERDGRPETEREMLASFAALTAHPWLAPQMGAAAEGGVPTRPALLAWPEAPTSFADRDPGLRAALGSVARAEGAPLIVDAVGASEVPDPQGRYQEFVSASFYLPDGSYAGRYDKMHLVPFGEYTPYKPLFFFAGHLLDGLDFVPGTERRLFSVEGHRYGVFICYESIFGDEIREFAESGAQVLVNLSDDGWYGDTSAPWEHLDMARMRAIENRRWLLRDTNTGLTGSIDPEGRVVASLPRHVRDAVAVPFAYRSDLTFYTRHGDWIGWLSAVVVVALLCGSALQRRFPRASANR